MTHNKLTPIDSVHLSCAPSSASWHLTRVFKCTLSSRSCQFRFDLNQCSRDSSEISAATFSMGEDAESWKKWNPKKPLIKKFQEYDLYSVRPLCRWLIVSCALESRINSDRLSPMMWQLKIDFTLAYTGDTLAACLRYLMCKHFDLDFFCEEFFCLRKLGPTDYHGASGIPELSSKMVTRSHWRRV